MISLQERLIRRGSLSDESSIGNSDPMETSKRKMKKVRKCLRGPSNQTRIKVFRTKGGRIHEAKKRKRIEEMNNQLTSKLDGHDIGYGTKQHPEGNSAINKDALDRNHVENTPVCSARGL